MKTYQRVATLSDVNINLEKGIVTGINDFGSYVVMTLKQFRNMYKEVV